METVRVYVSSTKADFEEERRLVMDWLVAQQMLPVHSYVADTETVRDSCLADIASCQVYVLLLGHRYGSRVAEGNPDRLSITHLEFRHARELGIPTVALLRTSIPDAALSSFAHPQDGPAVLGFRDEVAQKVRPAQFADATALVEALSHGIAALLRRGSGGARGWQWPPAWDFGAFMADKRARFSGRQWLHAEVQDWLARPGPRALLVCAGYGVGKSAFVSDLVHRDARREPADRQIAACHFCQHDTRETLRAASFVRDIAAQLAARFPAYRASVDGQRALQALLDNAADDPGSAFEAAVLNPLHRIAAPALPQLLLVDAIDESLEADGSDTERRALLRLLGAKATRFPPWLRLLVTSRDNPAVRERLAANFGLHEVDAEARANLDDIEAYARQRCAEPPIGALLGAAGLAPEDAARLLRTKSGGKFLYAVRALDDLAAGRLDAARLAALPPGMDGFYLDAFERRFGAAGADPAPAARLLGLMSAAREPLPPELLAAALGEPVRALKVLRSERLGDFIRLRDGCWAFDHFSLREWLTGDNDAGEPRAGAFAVDLPAALASLAGWGERCAAEPGGDMPDHVLRHLAAYLHDSGAPQRVAALLLQLRWLHMKLKRFGPASLWPDFALAPHDAGLDTLRRTLDRSAHILRRDPDQLAGQLLGRLGEQREDSLAPLLAACRAWHGTHWLRPRTASLAPPGALVRVLQGHRDAVTTVAFEPTEGRLLLTASDDRSARLWNESGEAVAVLSGHGGFVRHAAFSPDGRLVLTASEDGTARLWRTDGEAVAVLRGHRRRIRHAAFSPDGQCIATAGDDLALHLWSVQGALLVSLEGHASQVRHVAFSRDGQALVSASYDRSARIWGRDGRCRAVLAGHGRGLSHAVFAPDGGTVLTASHDNTARLWRTDGTPLQAFVGHTSTVNHAVFSPDGRTVLTASADTTARLWRLDGTLLRELRGHARRVHRAVFSPDGSRILTASVDGTTRLWSFDGELLAELEGNTNPGEQAAFSPDGQLVATACSDRAARVWRHAAPGRPGAATGPVFEVRNERIAQVLVSPDRGAVLSRGARRGVELWTGDGERVAVLRGHADVVRKSSFGADGQRVLTNSYDGIARLWRRDGTPVAELAVAGAEVLHVALSRDGALVAAACSDGTGRIWSADGAAVATLHGHAAPVNQVAFSPAGDLLATASSDAGVRLWSSAGAPIAELAGLRARVMRVLFSPDGTRLVACAKDGGVGLWTHEGRLCAILAGHTTVVRNTCFSPDSARLLTASADGLSRLWTRDGAPVAQLEGSPASGKRSPFARDGALLLAASSGLDLLVWADPAAGAPQRLGGHTGPVAKAVFVADGTRVLSAAEDASLRLWSRTGELLAALDVDAPITALDAQGPVIACGDASGQVHFLAVEGPG